MLSRFTWQRWVVGGLLLLGLVPVSAPAAVFWTETFDNGCTALCPGDGYAGVNGAWRAIDVTPPDPTANIWYVSCAESGNAEGACGSGCGVAADASLHVGNVEGSPLAILYCELGDCGAAYDAFVSEDKRIESPRIDTSGRHGLTVRFVFIGDAEPCDDGTDLVYSADDGGSWTVLLSCLVSNNGGCSGQGRWTATSAPLPVDAEDNPQLRLGFHWRSDGDLAASDPSFAVDDLTLEDTDPGGCPNPSPPGDVGNHLLAVKSPGFVDFDWSGMGLPPPLPTHYHVFRSLDPSLAQPAAWDLVAGDAPLQSTQTWSDPVLGDSQNYYYQLRSADDCETLSAQ